MAGQPKPRPMRPAILPLRPIIAPAAATASQRGSPTPSPSMSRRSSSSGSTTSSVTGKCVHFPCNPAKMAVSFLTHSREVYDRSPIIPSGEDLDIPSCKSADEAGWIKCLQRKAREAAQEGQPPPHTRGLPRNASGSSAYSSESSCSGSDHELAGLPSPFSDGSLSSAHPDDYSSCSETDDPLGPLSGSTATLAGFALREAVAASAHGRTASLEMYLSLAVREDPMSHWTGDVDMVSDDCEEEEPNDGHPRGAHGPMDVDAGARKPGMCALGKFSRQSLFENDAFGGF